MEEARSRNKASIMDALAAAGVTSVILAFDGNSDDGQIESVEARAGETTVELPTTQVLMLEEPEDDEKAEHGTSIPLAEANRNPLLRIPGRRVRGVGDRRRFLRHIHVQRP
jgi:hypothetical protein